MTAHRALLDADRWHFQHGPMDLVLSAEGDAAAVRDAHEDAWRRFEPLLAELVAELPALRAPVPADAPSSGCPLRGEVARRMWQACWPFRASFITPMAAVAGAVAQALVPAYERPGVARAWINNGGDIALHLASGESARIGLYSDIARLTAHDIVHGVRTDGHCDVAHAMPVRGVATSGWRGRSFSLGIADSVTVLAATAAQADAAATVIANAVDARDARIVRARACDLKDDSDLGELRVTVDVPPLDVATVRAALAAGLARAECLRAAGLVHGAFLACQGQAVSSGSAGAIAAQSATPRQVGSVFA